MVKITFLNDTTIQVVVKVLARLILVSLGDKDAL